MGFITPDMLDPVGAPAAETSSGGGSFITPDMLDPVDGPRAEPLTGWQKFAGGLANMLPLNAGDEIMAGIRTGADVLQGRPMGESYDANLNEIRGYEKAFEQEYPKLAIGTSVAGNAPAVVAAPTKIGTVKGFWPTLKALATEGAAWGGASGFLGGEGAANRLEGAGTGAAIGAGANVALGGAAAGFGKLASRGSDDTLKQALDIQRSELKAARKFTKDKTAPNPLMEAIRGADERGVFSIGDDAASFVAKNEDQIAKFGDEVTNIIKAADNVPTPKDPIAYNNAEKFVKSNPFQEEGLAKQLEDRLATMDQAWDGTLAGLNSLKQKLYKIAYKGTTESRELDQALASDLRQYIESQASKLLGPKAGKEISRLNGLQGQHLTIRKQLDKLADKDNMSGGLGLAIRRATVSPVGGAAGGFLGGTAATLATGDPSYMAKGALWGLAGGTLGSRGGQLAVSRALKPVGENLTGSGARAALPALVPALSPDRSASNESSSAQRTPELSRALPTTTGGTEAQRIPNQATQDKSLKSSSNSTPKANAPQYPLKSSSVFQKLSTAVEKVESAGVADAVSNKGAVGLMQVRPIAAREVFRMAGIDDSEFTNAELSKKLKDPTFNKQIGEAYLQMLIDKYGGLELALAAYNAGPTLVDKLRKSEGKSYADIRDKLPAETRAYVPKVRSIFEKA